MNFPRPRVRAFISIFERSSSLAAHVDTDVGEYVIKVRNNPEGPRILVNEWIGTSLARHLGVLTPDFGVVDVPELIDIPLRAGLRAEAGPAFGSRFERVQPWAGGSSVVAVANPEIISRLIVLDTWILNVDRYSVGDDNRIQQNRHNILLSTEGAPEGKFSLKAIDHGHCFRGTSWRAHDLRKIAAMRDRRVYGLFPEFRAHLERPVVGAALAAASEIRPGGIRTILRGIPREWGLSHSEAEVVEGFLVDRAKYLLAELTGMLWPQTELGDGKWR